MQAAKIKVLIADSEPQARARLRTLLRKEPDVSLVGDCVTGDETLARIRATTPDLVFMDVGMAGMDGLSVLRLMPTGQDPLVVFTTSLDGRAIRAFEARAVYFLLKPLKPSSLAEAVARAREKLAGRPLPPAMPAEPIKLRRISVRVGSNICFIRLEHIDWIESAGNYAVIHCGPDNHVVRDTIKKLEENLPAQTFLRVSRSALVNRDRVREIHATENGCHVVVLSNATQIPLTRGAREVEQSLRFS